MTTTMKAMFGTGRYTMGAGGQLEKVEEAQIAVGQIVFLNGYNQSPESHDRQAVYEIVDGRFGRQYKCVNLDKFTLSTHDHIRPVEKLFGIGIYYKTGDVATKEEIAAALPIALDNQRKASEERDTKQKEEDERRVKAAEWWSKNTPEGAVMAIIGTFEEDCSDPMSDYFNHRTVRTILLGFSESKRNNFAELRKAAANAEETKFLATYDRSMENRDKAWYFLGKWSSGWQVRKASFGNVCVTDSENIKLPKTQVEVTVTGSKPSGDKIATCKINNAKGGIELYFPGKPSSSVLDDLKANGFRWSRFGKCWYKLDNSIARRVAAKYANVPQSLNATERLQDAGLVDAQEQAAIANGNY